MKFEFDEIQRVAVAGERSACSPRVGGKFEIKGAQRPRPSRLPDLRKFIHRGQAKLTEKRREKERKRHRTGRERSMVSRRVILCETLWPPWSDCIPFRYIFSRGARNWLANVFVLCFLPTSTARSRRSVSRLVPRSLFLAISSEMGQVLRRVYVEIDGTRILPWERCTI